MQVVEINIYKKYMSACIALFIIVSKGEYVYLYSIIDIRYLLNIPTISMITIPVKEFLFTDISIIADI